MNETTVARLGRLSGFKTQAPPPPLLAVDGAIVGDAKTFRARPLYRSSQPPRIID